MFWNQIARERNFIKFNFDIFIRWIRNICTIDFLTGSQVWNLFSWIYLCYQACKWLIHDSCPNKYKKIWHWWCLWKRSLKGPDAKRKLKNFYSKVFWHAETKKLPNDDNFCYSQNLLISTNLLSNLLSSNTQTSI